MPIPPIALGSSSGFTDPPPLESCAAPTTLLGFVCPYSDIGSKVHPGFHPRSPGVPPPERSAFRVSHPPDGLLPLNFPATRTGTTHGVHPPELLPPVELYAFRRLCPPAVSDIAFFCSEDQEIEMPRNSRALFPTEDRTNTEPRTREGRYSHGLLWSPLRSVPRSAVGAVSRPVPSCAFCSRSRGIKCPALQGFASCPSRRHLSTPSCSLEVCSPGPAMTLSLRAMRSCRLPDWK